MLEVSSCHSNKKSDEDTNIYVWCASCKQALRVKLWNPSTPLQCFHRCKYLCDQKKRKRKSSLSVLTVCFPAVGILQHLCDCDRHIQQADDIRTEINMSNSHCQWLGKSSKSLETFCVKAASQASQLLKIYRTIKTGGWKEPWDKFHLLLSG